jgi:hypothetical protein
MLKQLLDFTKNYMIIILFFIIVFLISCDSPNDCITKRVQAEYDVELKVTGTSETADILAVVEFESADTTMLSAQELPWLLSFSHTGDSWVYLVAQNTDTLGTVSASIVINYEVVQSDSQYHRVDLSRQIDGDLYMMEETNCP